MHGDLKKPLRGTALLERRTRHKALKHHETAEMQAAKIRDGRTCRAPFCREKDLPLDGAHAFGHRQMGGNPKGDRTARRLIVSLCRKHHGELDGGLLSCEPLDAEQMADGCLAWYRPSHDTGRMECFAVETRIGVSVSRT